MFDRLLARGIRHGCITVIDPSGRKQSFGRGHPRVTIRLADRAIDWALALNPSLKVGEAYMDGRLTIEEGSLYDLIDISMANTSSIESERWQRVIAAFHTVARWWHQHNPVGVAREHVAHHYDLSRRLFELFLDESMQYSCAYFTQAEHDARRRAARQDAPHRGQAGAGAGPDACSTSAAAGAGSASSSPSIATSRWSASRCPRSSTSWRPERASGSGRRQAGHVQAAGLSARDRHLRPHRVGRHVRACRRQALSGILRRGRTRC